MALAAKPLDRIGRMAEVEGRKLDVAEGKGWAFQSRDGGGRWGGYPSAPASPSRSAPSRLGGSAPARGGAVDEATFLSRRQRSRLERSNDPNKTREFNPDERGGSGAAYNEALRRYQTEDGPARSFIGRDTGWHDPVSGRTSAEFNEQSGVPVSYLDDPNWTSGNQGLTANARKAFHELEPGNKGSVFTDSLENIYNHPNYGIAVGKSTFPTLVDVNRAPRGGASSGSIDHVALPNGFDAFSIGIEAPTMSEFARTLRHEGDHRAMLASSIEDGRHPLEVPGDPALTSLYMHASPDPALSLPNGFLGTVYDEHAANAASSIGRESYRMEADNAGAMTGYMYGTAGGGRLGNEELLVNRGDVLASRPASHRPAMGMNFDPYHGDRNLQWHRRMTPEQEAIVRQAIQQNPDVDVRRLMHDLFGQSGR